MSRVSRQTPHNVLIIILFCKWTICSIHQQGGIYVFTMFDQQSGGISLLFLTLCEALTIGWALGTQLLGIKLCYIIQLINCHFHHGYFQFANTQLHIVSWIFKQIKTIVMSRRQSIVEIFLIFAVTHEVDDDELQSTN